MTDAAPDIDGLLPCPFDGSRAWLIVAPDTKRTRAQCTHCGASMGEFDQRSFAILAWNRRATPTPPAAPSELARELLRRASTVEHCGEDHISVADAEVLINRALTRREPEGLTEVVTWVPVEERVPDSRRDVHVFCAQWGQDIGWYSAEEKEWRGPYNGVTHWAEMPRGPSLSHLSAQPGQTAVTNAENNT